MVALLSISKVSSLKDLNCEPCPPGGQELLKVECLELLKGLSQGWAINESPNRLVFKYSANNFKESLEKANSVGKIAEEQWHHPNMVIGFKKFELEINTNVINGLRKADFIFAAKVDYLFNLSPR